MKEEEGGREETMKRRKMRAPYNVRNRADSRNNPTPRIRERDKKKKYLQDHKFAQQEVFE